MKDSTIGQITVVIPCYNAERWIARTLASVQLQGDVVGRIIVVDDGSTDDSLKVLAPFAKAGHITLIEGPNKGGCHARNRGLRDVETTYVMFLDADDALTEGVLQGSVEAAQAAGADVVFSRMEVRYPDGHSEHRGPFGPPLQTERQVFENWFDGDWLGTCCVTWRSEFVRSIGGWDENLHIGQDGDLVMRALLADARAARSEAGKGIYYRDNPGSVSMSGGVTEAKLAGHVDVIARTAQAARDKGWGDNLDRINAALYFLARKAFMEGYPDLGRRTLSMLRVLGDRHHHGTLGHRVLSGLLGLERKVRWFGS